MEISKEFIINHNLKIPYSNPDMECLLNQEVCLNITKFDLFDTLLTTNDIPPLTIKKVVVVGIARIAIKYVANIESQRVHVVNFEEPFSILIEWPGGPSVGTKLYSSIESEYEKFYAIDNRTISKTIVANVKVWTN